MPHGNISDRDLKYLRTMTLDRDDWAGVQVEYQVLKTTANFDKITGETEIVSTDYDDVIWLHAFVSVTKYEKPYSDRSQTSMGPEHGVTFRFGMQQLSDLAIDPKPKDRILLQGVEYTVWAEPKQQFVTHSPYNLDVFVNTKRQAVIAANPDLPFDTNPEVV